MAVIDKCLKKVGLSERCVTRKQCDISAECRFGTCQCVCGYQQKVNNN